jgi:hypothetical protein
VVAVGLTACVPPVAAKVYELPSLPATVTEVAFVAVTVKVEELPAAIEVGFAAMVTVGAGPDAATVTVAVAATVPPAPVAVAVYLVVALGLTACVPPAAASVYELPSLPLIVTEVAFAAVTVRVEDAPAAIDAGLAVIATVGRVFVGVETLAPHPASSKDTRRTGAVKKRLRQTDWRTRALIKVFSFQSLEGSTQTREAPQTVGPQYTIRTYRIIGFRIEPSRLSIPSVDVYAGPH